MDAADPGNCLDAERWVPDSAAVQHARRYGRLRGWGAATGRSSQVRGVQRAHRVVRAEAPQSSSAYGPRDPGEDVELRRASVSADFHLLRRLDELPPRQTHHRLLQSAAENLDHRMRRGESRLSNYEGLDGGNSGLLCDAQYRQVESQFKSALGQA